MLLINPPAATIGIADSLSGREVLVDEGRALTVRERAPTPDLMLAELRLLNLHLATLSGVNASASDFLEST